MKIVKVQVTCGSCGNEWLARGTTQNCPACGTPATTGWSESMEKMITGEQLYNHGIKIAIPQD